MKTLECIKTREEYNALHNFACLHPQEFWLSQSKILSWMSEPEESLNHHEANGNNWFSGGVLNVCFNCIDRHVIEDPSKIAIMFDDGYEIKRISYATLQREVCLAANMLLELGAKANDTVTIYLDSCPELAIFMLACARIGIRHNVIYRGFSTLSLSKRIKLSKSRVLITEDVYNKTQKSYVSEQLVTHEVETPSLETVLWLGDKPYAHQNSVSHYYYDESRKNLPLVNTPIPRLSSDDLFMFFLNNHKGMPEVITHNSGGFLLYNALTFKIMNNISTHDLFWSSYDLSWFEGHAQGLYGALANGATIYLTSSKLNSEAPALMKRVSDAHVTHAYLKNYLLKSMYEQDQALELTSLKSLVLSGEYISPDVFSYTQKSLNPSTLLKSSFTKAEFGGVLLSNWNSCQAPKPRSLGVPFPGIDIKIVDINGSEAESMKQGFLKTCSNWPSMPQSFLHTTAKYDLVHDDNPMNLIFKNKVSKDDDGDYWVDDSTQNFININGQNVSLIELESQIEEYDKIQNCIVFSVEDTQYDIELSAFIKLEIEESQITTNDFEKEIDEIKSFIQLNIDSFVQIKNIFICNEMPINPNGSIMKEALRKIINDIQKYRNHEEKLILSDYENIGFNTILNSYQGIRF